MAQDCASATDGISLSCAGQFRPSRLDELMTGDLAYGRLDGWPWIAQEWAASPVVVSPASPALSMRTSIMQWEAHARHLQVQKMEEAKALMPEGFAIPKPTGPAQSAIDVWSSLNVQSTDPDTARGVRGGVGADYKVAPGSVVGIAVDLRDDHFDGAPGSEMNHALAAYFAMKVDPAVTLDTTAHWGSGSGSLAGESFSTRESAVQARLRGAWIYDRLKFAPTLAVRHGVEHLDVGGATGTNARSSMTLAPQISRPFSLEGGRTLEPFVRYSEEWSVGTVDLEVADKSVDHSRSAGGGFNLAKPNFYSLSLSADVEGVTEAQPNVKSQIQLKVPLK